MSDKYLSVKKSVNGFSFANLGIFKGFGDGIIGAVWALVLLDIFHNSAAVGIYSSVYYVFFMLITLLSGEMLKLSSKAKLFYFSMMAVSVMYFMMAFSVKPATFIALDFVSAVPQMLISSLLSLFMADFSKDTGMEKLNGRYVLWVNAGALCAPVFAMFIANHFGIRAPFFAVAAINMLGLLYFKWFGIIQEDKKIPKISPKKTLKSIWKTTVGYFSRADLVRAYAINFGQYAIYALRVLYVPIMVIEAGFGKDVLGWVLTAGIVPYVILAEPIARLAKKTGIKLWVALGFLSFAAFSVWASFATGYTLLAIFVLWQISGAFIEPLTDIFFFNAAKGRDRERYFGIFKTVNRLPRFIVPIIGAGFIWFFGTTGAVWILTAIIGAAAGLFVLLSGRKKAGEKYYGKNN
ncbi:MAG: MFS transporter [Rickettsiales bacterium]|jgi:MFS family permease|nr:MFS transporter [Rickettsiales bacterium]